jgi:hypothetical protein
MLSSLVLKALAGAFGSGEQTAEAVAARGRQTLGRPWRWMGQLARRYLAAFAGRTRPRVREVVAFFRADEGFRRVRRRYARKLTVREWMTAPAQMQPVAAAEGWDVPRIESIGDLADWLHVTPGELDWYADLKGLTSRPGATEQLRHYRCTVLTKACGGLRLIEAPKPRVREVQQRILTDILDAIPVHSAAHGFCRGRSIKTFVAPHVDQRVVLRMDLRDFFPAVSRARVQALFRTVGYPEPVADLIGGLCTHATPLDVLRRQDWDARSLYRRPHLPQGAPTSPAIANLCAYRVDCRLSGLARACGAEYTRYADDLAFSGGAEFERRVERFVRHVAAILLEEGFDVHHRKTRIMRQGVRQHLAGLVANRSVNVVRGDFDRL